MCKPDDATSATNLTEAEKDALRAVLKPRTLSSLIIGDVILCDESGNPLQFPVEPSVSEGDDRG